MRSADPGPYPSPPLSAATRLARVSPARVWLGGSIAGTANLLSPLSGTGKLLQQLGCDAQESWIERAFDMVVAQSERGLGARCLTPLQLGGSPSRRLKRSLSSHPWQTAHSWRGAHHQQYLAQPVPGAPLLVPPSAVDVTQAGPPNLGQRPRSLRLAGLLPSPRAVLADRRQFQDPFQHRADPRHDLAPRPRSPQL